MVVGGNGFITPQFVAAPQKKRDINLHLKHKINLHITQHLTLHDVIPFLSILCMVKKKFIKLSMITFNILLRYKNKRIKSYYIVAVRYIYNRFRKSQDELEFRIPSPHSLYYTEDNFSDFLHHNFKNEKYCR